MQRLSDRNGEDRGSERGLVHLPVLVEEVLLALRVRPGGTYVDATCGPGGHVAAMLPQLGPEGRVLALDRDPQAAVLARARFAGDARVRVDTGSFDELGAWLESQGVNGRVDGILFDLGISSVQLDDPGRGFSFQRTGPLDMRMDAGTGVSAAVWLRRARESEIAQALQTLGEERYARRIARALVQARTRRPIETTTELAQLIAQTVPTRERGKHPATRTFLALRLLVNRELETLKSALPQALNALTAGGRLVVISFHSLEDREAKHFMRGQARATPPRLRLLGRPQRASAAERRRNPRARSAILRAAERTEVAHA